MDRITGYSFGSITVDGKHYSSDVIIYPDGVDSSWWRSEGHLLQPADLDRVLAAKPDVLVVGTGAMGVMKVPESTVRFLKGRGIDVRVARTAEAVKIYNGIRENTNAVAALHLTC